MRSLSNTSDDEKEYIEQFTREYRHGDKEFVKAESQSDAELIDETLHSMEYYEFTKRTHREAKLKPELSYQQASQYVKRDWLGRKNIRKINDMLVDDTMTRNGVHESIAARAFKVCLDKAKSRGLIRDSESITRKFKDCVKSKADLLKQLHDAQQKISRLETMIRVLGGTPDEANSYSTDVQEGGDSPE